MTKYSQSNGESLATNIEIPRHILLSVSKPGRYTGGEFNSVSKDPGKTDTRFAFCFPDIYEIGMSHLGMKILYHLINKRNDAFCERAFMPWSDMKEKMQEFNIPLYSLETKTPLSEFDILGFTLQYELSYTNVLAMLDMSNINFYSNERYEKDPIVIAGGPCAFNIEPVADFFDIVFVGEAEEQISDFLDIYNRYKSAGKKSKREFLLEVAEKIKGAYVPAFYDVSYNSDNTIKSIFPIQQNAPEIIKKGIVMDMNKSFYPEDFIVPNIEVIHDRLFLELFRGCSRGCRFCQAGFITRPVREKSPEILLEHADKAQKSTGYDEIGLLSLSTGDYSKIRNFSDLLLEKTEKTFTGLSLPSLRIDSFSLDLMEKARKTRKSGLTFAPEAGTDRLRNVINKNISETEIINSARLAFEGGWNKIKLYFMIGLPTETMEDIEGIGILVKKIEDAFYSLPKEKRKRKPEITVSASIFIPKPFTPFQWEPQEGIDRIYEKQKKLRSVLKSRRVKFLWHGGETSVWEAVLARGDRKLSRVLKRAYEKGCIFDSWDEYFRFDLLEEAMDEEGLEISFYANRKRSYSEVMPWDIIDSGVKKEFLVNESKKSLSGVTTSPCSENCSYCGAGSFNGGICIER